MSALTLAGVGRRFGGLVALHPIDLEVEPGACHALIGPNGAGKSTLVNLVAGALGPSQGRILLDGRDITTVPAARRAREGIGRTFQHPALFARLTVADNLAVAAGHRAAPILVDQVGLAEHAHVPAGRLPYGLQRRLELAMVLAQRPRLLLLDEPSAGLDPDEIARLAAQIRELSGQTTVLLVDHNLDLVWTLADMVTVLHHGRKLATGSATQIRADPSVQEAYLAAGDHRATVRQAVAGAALLRVRGLRAGYRGAPVLDGIDLDVREGEAVAVLGRNGAGKSTLLNAIAGLLPRSSAPAADSTVEIGGQDLRSLRPHEVARAGLTTVPQGRRLFGPLTVAEHLVCAQAARRGGQHQPGGTAWTPERVLDLLPALAARTRHKAARLSGGEQQMLALARALLTNPRLLILDEPSEGLAPAAIAQLTTALSTVVANGAAVLIAEQNLPLASAVADRVLLLDRGRIALRADTVSLPEQRERIDALLGVAPTTPA